MIDEVKKFGCECYWVYFDHEKRKRGWLMAVYKLFFLFKKINPDIIHTHLFDDSVPALIAAKMCKIKRTIVTKGDTAYHWFFARKGVIADRLINDLATDVVAISNESKEFIIKKEKAYYPKVKLIHHGIRIQERLDAIDEFKKANYIEKFNLKDKIVIGVVSRLVEWKGLKYIIDAAKEIQLINSNCKFVIVGSGDQQEELKSKIIEYNLQNQVLLVGWIDQNDMPSLFATFDIFLHAASMEPFGFVIAEAMSHSLAVLATNTGAAKDAIIHKENGFLIEPKDSNKIIEGILWIIENNKEKQLNKAAYKSAKEKFDFEFMFENYLNLYLNRNSNLLIQPSLSNYNSKEKKKVIMIIANSSNPAYFKWFAELNYLENAFQLSFVFLHTELPELANQVKKYNVKSYWINFNTYRRKHLQYLLASFKFYLLFCKLNPDVIHTNLFDDSLPALFAARLAHVKKRVITKQDTGYHVNFTPEIVKFDKFNNANATDLIACSEESKDFILKEEKGDINKIKLIHHGVDEKVVCNSKEEDVLFIKNKFDLHGKFIVGTVARYISLKGYHVMIDAAEIICKTNKNIIFLGIGWGAQKAEFEKIIVEKNLSENFILTDKVDYELIPSFYACMNVYLHAALFEPFGFVIAEAMFNKIPIISTKVGASRDYLEHFNSAYLIDFNNPKQIVDGINFYINNNTNNIIDNAYQIAKTNFAREKMWNEYRDLFLLD